jgi:hypothetical protein
MADVSMLEITLNGTRKQGESGGRSRRSIPPRSRSRASAFMLRAKSRNIRLRATRRTIWRCTGSALQGYSIQAQSCGERRDLSHVFQTA